jgi:flagellar motility protein MotE (MotC chaperone)
MTRKEMEQCRSLRQEIMSIERAMKHPKSTVVAVFYKDYRSGKGIPKSKQEIDNGEEELRVLKGKLDACMKRLTKRMNEAEDLIETKADGETGAILRMYYIAGMSQEEIGEDLHLTQGRISQIINSFWMSQTSKSNSD